MGLTEQIQEQHTMMIETTNSHDRPSMSELTAELKAAEIDANTLKSYTNTLIRRRELNRVWLAKQAIQAAMANTDI